MELPAGAREIGQAEMARRVGAEVRNASAQGERAHGLGPCPQRERLGAISPRLRDKEQPSGRGEFAPPGQVLLQGPPVGSEYGTTRARRVCVVSARSRRVR